MSEGRARQLLAVGRVSPDGAIARIAAREAAVEAEHLAQLRRDRRNERRRARRAEGKGTRPAGDTAPLQPEPVAVSEPIAPPAPPADGLAWCERCQRMRTYLEHEHSVLGALIPMTEADFERSDQMARRRWPSW